MEQITVIITDKYSDTTSVTLLYTEDTKMLTSRALKNFTKGVVAGVVVGAAAGMVIKNAAQPSRPFRRKTRKAINSVLGSFIH